MKKYNASVSKYTMKQTGIKTLHTAVIELVAACIKMPVTGRAEEVKCWIIEGVSENLGS